MANYQEVGNRWTAIFVVERERGDHYTYRKAPFEIVRFNVDVDPDAPEVIVPNGEPTTQSSSFGVATSAAKVDVAKVYEKIWIVDSIPFKAKTSFGPEE